jgi:heme-degrading monooxygenase HmoA
MISRQWKGIAKPGQADNYIEHLKTETFPQIAKIPGFVNASIMTRKVPKGTEFLVVTTWESIEAIKRFAGEDAEVAVVPDVVQEMMVEYDERVVHYEIVNLNPWSRAG